jgi:VanZ family protein
MTALRKIELWLLPVAWMGVIFAFSAQPNLNSGLGWIDHVGRKFIHAADYALLCFLWWRALRTKLDRTVALVPAFGITVLYAISDEYHQTFVTGRHGSWVDVLIDSMGAALVVLLVLRSQRRQVAS